MVPTINVWFFSTMLAGIEGVLRDADMDVLIYHVEGAEDRRQFFQRLPARRKVDAVIVIALPVPDDEAKRLDLMGVQVVVAGGRLREYSPCPDRRPRGRPSGREPSRQAWSRAHRDDSYR